MPICLSRLLLEPRTIALGHGVTIDMKPIGYAELKASQQTALRRARERFRAAEEASALVLEGDEGAALYNEQIWGLAEELQLDILVERFATGWQGVSDQDGKEPLPLTPETWELFRSVEPARADALFNALRYPCEVVADEGKS